MSYRWSEKLESRFKNYEGQMGPANMGPEAKRTLFHGTKSLCGLLQAADLHQRSSPHQGLCTNPDGCNACSIISRGFKLSKVGPGNVLCSAGGSTTPSSAAPYIFYHFTGSTFRTLDCIASEQLRGLLRIKPPHLITLCVWVSDRCLSLCRR